MNEETRKQRGDEVVAVFFAAGAMAIGIMAAIGWVLSAVLEELQ